MYQILCQNEGVWYICFPVLDYLLFDWNLYDLILKVVFMCLEPGHVIAVYGIVIEIITL